MVAVRVCLASSWCSPVLALPACAWRSSSRCFRTLRRARRALWCRGLGRSGRAETTRWVARPCWRAYRQASRVWGRALDFPLSSRPLRSLEVAIWGLVTGIPEILGRCGRVAAWRRTGFSPPAVLWSLFLPCCPEPALCAPRTYWWMHPVVYVLGFGVPRPRLARACTLESIPPVLPATRQPYVDDEVTISWGGRRQRRPAARQVREPTIRTRFTSTAIVGVRWTLGSLRPPRSRMFSEDREGLRQPRVVVDVGRNLQMGQRPAELPARRAGEAELRPMHVDFVGLPEGSRRPGAGQRDAGAPSTRRRSCRHARPRRVERDRRGAFCGRGAGLQSANVPSACSCCSRRAGRGFISGPSCCSGCREGRPRRRAESSRLITFLVGDPRLRRGVQCCGRSAPRLCR